MSVITSLASDQHDGQMALLGHQLGELEYLKAIPRAFLLSQTGTGKTPTLLRYADWVMSLERGQVLWVTEAGLVDQLCSEADKWLTRRDVTPTRLGVDCWDSNFMVASHHWLASNREWLLGRQFDLVVVDEAHAVRAGGLNGNAPIFAAIREAVARSYRSVLATGTPVITQHGLDLFALLEAGQAPGLMPRQEFLPLVNWTDEESSDGTLSQRATGLMQDGIRHLQKVLAWNAVATEIDSVSDSIPAVSRDLEQVPCDGVPIEQALANRALSTIHSALEKGQNHILVFADSRDVFEATHQALSHSGIPFWEVTGDVKIRDRTRALADHAISPRGVLLGTQAIEAGLNLQHCSGLLSIVTRWSRDHHLQREGRIRRLGSRFESVWHKIVVPEAPDGSGNFRTVGWQTPLQSGLMADVLDASDWAMERDPLFHAS